ncbi:MAG TPA: MASE1 domain-containing protein [Opitutaceae bacterium]
MKWPLIWGVIAAAYFVSGRLCISASAHVADVSWILYVPAGISLTAALLGGSRVWPGVLLGEFAVNFTSGQPAFASLLMATGNTLEAALAGWWFKDRLGRRLEFDRMAEIVAFLLAVALILQPLSTAFGITALKLAGNVPAGSIGATASAWYASNLFAELMFAPAVLAWLRWPKPANDSASRRELLALGVLTLTVGAFGPGRWAPPGFPLPVALFFAIPLLVWAAIRFVPSVAVTVGATLGLFAFDAMLAHSGAGATSRADDVVYLNVFMGVCLATGLFLSAAMGQERRHKAEQAELIIKLKSASDQVKRLEEFVTFCAWTGRVRWNEQWVSVEKFLQDRYNVSISHGISEDALSVLRARSGAGGREN